MRFIHIADIHASRERLPQTLHILSTLTERAKQGDIDFIIFAGDFWDATITATKGSGFSDIISAVSELKQYTHLYFIYGTPTHEPLGSLDAFQSDKTFVYSANGFDIAIGTRQNGYRNTEIIMIPEPRRSEYIGSSISETDKAINDAIKDFITSRKERRTDYNRIVVYHGEVRGAVYQNGVSASSPTAIPKELLQSLNADYYALGHIHAPQEVFPNAWYSGSACPKDFGETHDGSYNLVTIEKENDSDLFGNGFKTTVERVSFGLPTYETYDMFLSDFSSTKNDFTNKHIRIRFDCTKEEKKSLDLAKIKEEIKKRTNALSVKLEPTVTESETTAKSEVVKRKSLTEKMSEYAKEKSLKIPKGAKELLHDIEDNTLIALNYPQHSFELLSLSLRGAIGIRDGQHKEDFFLDFEKFDDGVVCLIGQNGRGKTTLIENCHPYPCMLTRNDTLKENFYLKDSHRILVYRDENGLYYKISMLIDGKTKTGSVSYFVETSTERKSWTSIPEVDGSLYSYNQWVNSTFGSIDVFLRTAFFAKEQTKGTPDISATTKSERMELLSKLAGTEHLKEVSVIARDKRKETEKQAEKIEAEIDSYAKFERTIKDNEQDIISWRNELKEQESVIAIGEKKVAELRAKDAEYQKVKAVSEANSALYEQYKKEFDETKAHYDKFDEVINNMQVYEEIERNNRIVAENAPKIEALMTKSEEKERRLSEAMEETSRLNKVISGYKVELAKLESDEKLLRSQIADVSEVCPTCGAPLSAYKREELRRHVEGNQKALEEVLKKIDFQKGVLKRAEEQLKEKDIVAELKEEIGSLASRLADLQSESQIYADFIESVDQIYTEYTYDDAIEEHQKLSKELDDLQKKMDGIAISETCEDVSEELAEAERRLQSDRNRLSDLQASIRSAEKENDRYREELAKSEENKKEKRRLEGEIAAYLFIEDAFSNNGIPAIELRESAPEIAEVANKILHESYGTKFDIRFGKT